MAPISPLGPALGLVVLLAAAHPPTLEGQWSVSAEVGAARFWGGAAELAAPHRSLRPYRPTLVGVGLERRIGRRFGLGLRVQYAPSSLALEGTDAVVAVKDLLERYAVAPELSLGLVRLGPGGELRLAGGPVLEFWSLGLDDLRVRAGGAIALGLEVPLGGPVSGLLRAGAGLSASPFREEDLDAGFEPRALGRREVLASLRCRL